MVPSLRITAANRAAPQPEGAYVLYWMTAFRRVRYNFALQRAVEWCRELAKPLLVFEPLRADYPWASERLHRFVIQGMSDNGSALARSGTAYFPYLEPSPGAARGLLATLARRACVVITDDFPCFFLPAVVARAAERLPVRLEKVDSNGILPLRATSTAFTTAHAFRRFLQSALPDWLVDFPMADPLAETHLPAGPAWPAEILARWPPLETNGALPEQALARMKGLDRSVTPAAIIGGAAAGAQTLHTFLAQRLAGYHEHRNDIEDSAASGLSPYLHFGHISAHEVFAQLAAALHWTPNLIATGRPTGKRAGWWNMSAAAEGFLDELVIWRELGFNQCAHLPHYDQYESLPAWARATLEKHEPDVRAPCYGLAELEEAATHDRLWNAAQRQLVREGRMHNYLRMLWGKKILQWSATPRAALQAMIHLNNKYAVDGRDPNSYNGIFWCLGRNDRPWGPQRPIFGTVRYMTSENTARKLNVKNYLARYGNEHPISRQNSG